MSFDTIAVALAVLAVLMAWTERHQEASVAGYLSLLATQLGRLRARRPAAGGPHDG